MSTIRTAVFVLLTATACGNNDVIPVPSIEFIGLCSDAQTGLKACYSRPSGHWAQVQCDGVQFQFTGVDCVSGSEP